MRSFTSYDFPSIARNVTGHAWRVSINYPARQSHNVLRAMRSLVSLLPVLLFGIALLAFTLGAGLVLLADFLQPKMDRQPWLELLSDWWKDVMA